MEVMRMQVGTKRIDWYSLAHRQAERVAKLRERIDSLVDELHHEQNKLEAAQNEDASAFMNPLRREV